MQYVDKIINVVGFLILIGATIFTSVAIIQVEGYIPGKVCLIVVMLLTWVESASNIPVDMDSEEDEDNEWH